MMDDIRNPLDIHLLQSYPEIAAGGFTRDDGTIQFYSRVSALLMELTSRPRVLDFGAGRGSYLEDPVPFRREIRHLRRLAYVIGVDIDAAVLSNHSVDEAFVIGPDGTLPVSAGAIDLIVSDFTFEHIAFPQTIVDEFCRVLRPGGWICARTPNRHGYIGIGGRLVPNAFHVAALRLLQPDKHPEDTFPTQYRLNTPKQIRRWFAPAGFQMIIYSHDSEPRYTGRSPFVAAVNRRLSSVTPPALRSMLFVFLKKGAENGASGSEERR
jgi:SAM-dependent methyltransferase